jgi:hypothetical protein
MIGPSSCNKENTAVFLVAAFTGDLLTRQRNMLLWKNLAPGLTPNGYQEIRRCTKNICSSLKRLHVFWKAYRMTHMTSNRHRCMSSRPHIANDSGVPFHWVLGSFRRRDSRNPRERLPRHADTRFRMEPTIGGPSRSSLLDPPPCFRTWGQGQTHNEPRHPLPGNDWCRGAKWVFAGHVLGEHRSSVDTSSGDSAPT